MPAARAGSCPSLSDRPEIPMMGTRAPVGLRPRMSNCHLVAARSLIDLAASRLALRAPALRAATALTRPNRSAQRLPCGRHVVPPAVAVGPYDIAELPGGELEPQWCNPERVIRR